MKHAIFAFVLLTSTVVLANPCGSVTWEQLAQDGNNDDFSEGQKDQMMEDFGKQKLSEVAQCIRSKKHLSAEEKEYLDYKIRHNADFLQTNSDVQAAIPVQNELQWLKGLRAQAK
ncbi:hypothetical protein CIK05_00410 [Bdellovibrio sp. qaytius]|nr:hypothetical protein CIK05_00410 [Bdellovibrio sp. qaytius]